jgi:Peptidase family M28
MLNGRLYRAAFVPFLFALAIAAFSLGSRPLPYTSTLAPDAFEAAPAFAELQKLASAYPLRAPGGPGDEALARYVAHKLEGLGGTAGGGFSVHTYHFDGQTVDGERSLSTVVAQRPGSTSAAPILILAHRDSAGARSGGASSTAQLSATAALLELARVFSARETKRTIVLVSTSGGSGGDAGAARLAADPSAFGLQGPFDAAIVVGDLAGVHTAEPMVVPFSDGLGSAPLELQRTLAAAISQQTGAETGAPSTLGQLAHLAFPLTLGEQGVLDAGGIPAVLVQVSGERGPAAVSARSRADGGVSAERLEVFGRAVLSGVDALDTAPNVTPSMQTGLLLAHKTMPAWALQLLIATLLFPPLVAALDGLARMRRRRVAVGRWTLWTLSCALPFLSCAVFVYVLGWLGVLGAAPGEPSLPSSLPLDARAVTAIVALGLTFALAWLLWAALLRRLGWSVRPNSDAAGLSSVLVLLAVGSIAWLANPFAALLALPALHLWLALVDPDRLRLGDRPSRSLALGVVVLGLLPLLALVGFYAHQFGLGVGDVVWMGVVLLAGGHVGLGGALVWSVAFGCVAATALVAARPTRPPAEVQLDEGIEVTIRGPLSYAGPGSLGGTESALRR